MKPDQQKAVQWAFVEMLREYYAPIVERVPKGERRPRLSNDGPDGGLRAIYDADGTSGGHRVSDPKREFAVALLDEQTVNALVAYDQISVAWNAVLDATDGAPTDETLLRIFKPLFDRISGSGRMGGKLGLGAAAVGTIVAAGHAMRDLNVMGRLAGVAPFINPAGYVLGAYLATNTFNKALKRAIELHADPNSPTGQLLHNLAELLGEEDLKALLKYVLQGSATSVARKQSGAASRKWDDANADFRDEDLRLGFGNRGSTGHGSDYKN